MVDQFPPELRFWASQEVRGFSISCRRQGAGPGRQPGEEAEPERTPALPTAVVVVSRSWGSGEQVSRGVPRRLEDWKTPEKTR